MSGMIAVRYSAAKGIPESQWIVERAAMPVEIVHWNPVRPVFPGRLGRRLPVRRAVNNFGDMLGPLLTHRILESHGLSSRTPDEDVRLMTIGSIMHLSQPGDIVWGTGVNGKTSSTGAAPDVDVRAVRGPLTREALTSAGTVVPEVYGDPGLLWGLFWPLSFYRAKKGRRVVSVSVVPNFHEWSRYRGTQNAINPRLPPHEVIGQIAQSSLIVGSSLHGIVIAESFGIPARLVQPRTEPAFKYQDYYAGTGRPSFTPAKSVSEAIRMGGEPAPVWDADKLLQAFPIDLWSTGG